MLELVLSHAEEPSQVIASPWVGREGAISLPDQDVSRQIAFKACLDILPKKASFAKSCLLERESRETRVLGDLMVIGFGIGNVIDFPRSRDAGH